MNPLVVDMETHYDSDYSLSKMQTDEYILDDRFEIIMCGVLDTATGVYTTHTVDHRDLESLGRFRIAYDWGNRAVLCHHTHFDGFILTQRLGIKPKLWLDTLSMGRMAFPWLKSHSLDAMAKHMGLPAKGTYVANVKGMRRDDFSPGEFAAYAAYCEHDVHLCHRIYDQLRHRTPALEFLLIDMTVRMFTEPAFAGDVPLLQKLVVDEEARKQQLLAAAATDREIIMSNPKFADALRSLGVEPPLKVSVRTGKVTYAFSKADKAFTALLEHDDPTVVALVEARLGTKSTIAQTRAQRFASTALRGLMPVYLGFWGAKTTGRYSGGNKTNWQNLPARGPVAGIRKAIGAPPGRVVVAGDSSNIELRMVMAVAGQWDVLDKLRKGIDLYCDFATKIFGRVITKADAAERQLGKVAMLSLQYGAGAERFAEMVRLEVAKNPKGGLKPITIDEALRIVTLYRNEHPKVVALWRYCEDTVLPAIANRHYLTPVDVNGWCITVEDGFQQGANPGVMYKDLKYDSGDGRWTYLMGHARVGIYGAKVVENLCVDGLVPVLTDRGWIPLREITNERVHDGLEFVHHGGIIHKGVKHVVEVDGVRMTPEHEVLTDDGWAEASQVQRPYRPDIRGTDRAAADFVTEREMGVAFSLYLRSRGREAGPGSIARAQARRTPELRLHDQAADRRRKHHTWNDDAPCVRGLPQYAVALPVAIASSVEKLRRAGHNGVRALAQGLQAVLGGHGPDVLAGAYAGSQRQQRAVQSGELPVGGLADPGRESARVPGSEPVRSVEANRDRCDDAGIPLAQGASRRGAGRAATSEQTAPATEVWDILNCGPRNRFVVLGANGPFIVHNCQHLARHVVMWQTGRIHSRYPVKLSVHDEAVCVPLLTDLDACRTWMTQSLSLAPPWCRGVLPVACEVKHGATYGDCK